MVIVCSFQWEQDDVFPTRIPGHKLVNKPEARTENGTGGRKVAVNPFRRARGARNRRPVI